MSEIKGLESIDPNDLQDKLLVIRTARDVVDPMPIYRELAKLFTAEQIKRVIIIPDDWTLMLGNKKHVVSQLKALISRLGGA